MHKIDELTIKTLRVLSVEQIAKASSGHPGIALGAAPIIHVLYSRILKVTAKKPDWFNRDRFILAAVMVQRYFIHYYILRDIK